MPDSKMCSDRFYTIDRRITRVGWYARHITILHYTPPMTACGGYTVCLTLCIAFSSEKARRRLYIWQIDALDRARQVQYSTDKGIICTLYCICKFLAYLFCAEQIEGIPDLSCRYLQELLPASPTSRHYVLCQRTAGANVLDYFPSYSCHHKGISMPQRPPFLAWRCNRWADLGIIPAKR